MDYDSIEIKYKWDDIEADTEEEYIENVTNMQYNQYTYSFTDNLFNLLYKISRKSVLPIFDTLSFDSLYNFLFPPSSISNEDITEGDTNEDINSNEDSYREEKDSNGVVYFQRLGAKIQDEPETNISVSFQDKMDSPKKSYANIL